MDLIKGKGINRGEFITNNFLQMCAARHLELYMHVAKIFHSLSELEQLKLLDPSQQMVICVIFKKNQSNAALMHRECNNVTLRMFIKEPKNRE